MRQVDMDQEGRSTGTDPILGAVEQLLANGIPVHFEKTVGADGKDALYVYLDEVLLKQLGPLLPMVESLIPEDMAFEASILGKTISVPIGPILENLPGALEVTTAGGIAIQRSRVVLGKEISRYVKHLKIVRVYLICTRTMCINRLFPKILPITCC